MQRIDVYAGSDIKGPHEKEGVTWYAVVLTSAPEYFVGKTEKIRATENTAVLTALAHALARIRKPCAMRIHANKFVCGALNQHWMDKWAADGWKTSRGAPIKNKDAWRKVAAGVSGREIIGTYVLTSEEEQKLQQGKSPLNG